MGKRKLDIYSTDTDTNLDVESSPIKHKKHKHKKHKKEKVDADEGAAITSKPSLKLTIKIGKGNTKSSSKLKGVGLGKGNQPGVSTTTGSSDISDEDEWLEALESGKLDPELNHMKNPALMTARQRALLDRKSGAEGDFFPDLPPTEHVALETIRKPPKKSADEIMKSKAVLASKRKILADEKREKSKIKTIDRLLKKQETNKARLLKGKKKTEGVKITYINGAEHISLSLPAGFDFPLAQQLPVEPPPEKQLCGVAGCRNPSKYACSKTGVRLCSLECYKANLLVSSSLKQGLCSV